MNVVKWDDYFMNLVYLVATRSKDKNTHIGAIIVGPDNEIRSVGYNSFPRGINDDVPERQERPEKYNWFAHAERNAIYNAARVGIPTCNCIMYTNGTPCCDCAFGIINSGIKKVVIDKEWDNKNSGKWEEHAKRTKIMFDEAGVEIRYWEGDLFSINKYRDGGTIKN